MAWNPGQPLFGGRYIIERKLGEGGIGITYLARNQQDEFRVIKTLKEQILNHPDWVPHRSILQQSFCEEALRLSLCRHPHIVQIENAFSEGIFPCMAMEYIEGEDLGKRITLNGALLEAEALVYIRQIGNALSLVHKKGLLHRDIKPNNIMMRTGTSQAVLIDFGLAQGFIPDVTHTLPGGLTHGFAPPEQYLPKARWGEYTDVYALAATLYALLTRQLPTPAPARLQNVPLRIPQSLNSSISDSVNEAIIWGMAMNSQMRPQSVEEWFNLLATTGETSAIKPVTQVPSTPQPSIQNLKSSNSFVVASQNWYRLNTIPGIGDTFALDPDGRILAIATNSIGKENSINLVETSYVELGICRHTHTLTGHSKEISSLAFGSDGDITKLLASGDLDGTIKIWDVTTGEEVQTLHHSDWPIYSVAFSPDKEILASGGREGTVQLWDIATGREIYSSIDFKDKVGGECRIYSVAFSPIIYASFGQKNVQMLAIGRHSYMTLLLVADGKEVYFNPKNVQMLPSANSYLKPAKEAPSKAIFIPCGRVNSVAFSPDGQLLATAGNGIIRLWQISYRLAWRIELWPISCRQEQEIVVEEICHLTGHYGDIYSIAFSQDRRILASGGSDGTIKLWEVATGKEIRTFSDDPDRIDRISSVGFSLGANGEILASSSLNTISLRQVETGREIHTFAGNTSRYVGSKKYIDSMSINDRSRDIDPIVLSPDGQILASGSFRWIQLWEVRTGRAIKILREHEYPVKSIAFSPDGLLLASGGQDNVIKLWHVGTGKEIKILYGHSHTVYSVAFSPDGQLLVSTSSDGTIRLWQVADGSQIRNLTFDFRWMDRWKSITLSPDGQLLAIGTEYTREYSKYTTIKIWQVETGAEIYTFTAPSDFNSFAFSFDRQLLAIATQDKTIKLLDVATGTEIHTFTASSQVHSISFSANKQFLAIGEYGGNIQIWQRR
ncbi:protein kinase [Tolypothrix campylonemoides VB511288]|nr:protein kinase [Tolypothrix campylonemoides VB511288]